MPLYEYECESCGRVVELLIRGKQDERDAACPKCRGKKLRRLPSVFAAHAAAPKSTPLPRGGCGRCGDPNGPCGLD